MNNHKTQVKGHRVYRLWNDKINKERDPGHVKKCGPENDY